MTLSNSTDAEKTQRASKRLPVGGLLINRDKPLSFSFAGKSYKAFEGDTLASALLANGEATLSRSFKYHRPRGPLTMAGLDANTLVQYLPCEANNHQAEPNVLADKTLLKEGDCFDGQNYSGSLKKDKGFLLGYLSSFMPVGFYYQAFYKSLLSRLSLSKKKRDSWPKWEPLIRKKAGLGVIDINSKAEGYDKEYRFCDVLIVGAGPAGLAAALQAAEAQISVVLVDEMPVLGGSLNFLSPDVNHSELKESCFKLIEKIKENKNIEVLLSTTCNGWFADNYLPLIRGNRMYKMRAKTCVFATGSLEQHVVFRNNDLPGIMLCSAASRLMFLYGVKPGHRAVVLAGNDDAYLTALQLVSAGVRVKAIIDMRGEPVNPVLQSKIEALDIVIMLSSAIYEALPLKGHHGVRAVDVRKIAERGKLEATGEIIECDLLCVSAGFIPAYQLPCQAGGKLDYHDGRAEFNLLNLPANVFLAGSVNNKYNLDDVINDGLDSARSAINVINSLNQSGFSDSDVKTLNLEELDFGQLSKLFISNWKNFSWPIFPHPLGKDFVDFDEDLQSQDIVNATRLGYRDIQLVKRFSTLGMGPSQGRHSALAAARLVAEATGRTVADTGVTTARPPYAEEKLAHIAGQCFEPYRRTPMHYQHLALGAQMMPAGLWARPAYYGQPSEREACIQRESKWVRNNVGVIDVSTLGGLDIRGADAAEFMNRLYTFGFIAQPVGKTRYAILTNEQGTVVDDGVACRLADDYFYVTATTTGVDQVYRRMTHWNAQWRLDVDIANVSSTFAALNLAGPNSRKVLQKLVTDMDLSADKFPHLAFRQGTVAGIPSRCLRVGFVGELGYEIHVPNQFGAALWGAILEAGQEFDIRPFGVEAQRLLRLEKGHIIVGQDTDGMSHPGELNLTWAISKKKPFYVGGRSVDIALRKNQTRKLVGFTLATNVDRPKEGHLVLSDNSVDRNGLIEVKGHITSCEYSPTLKCVIGLAFVGVEQTTLGEQFPIRVDDGHIVRATVSELPFYDKEGVRTAL